MENRSNDDSSINERYLVVNCQMYPIIHLKIQDGARVSNMAAILPYYNVVELNNASIWRIPVISVSFHRFPHNNC